MSVKSQSVLRALDCLSSSRGYPQADLLDRFLWSILQRTSAMRLLNMCVDVWCSYAKMKCIQIIFSIQVTIAAFMKQTLILSWILHFEQRVCTCSVHRDIEGILRLRTAAVNYWDLSNSVGVYCFLLSLYLQIKCPCSKVTI